MNISFTGYFYTDKFKIKINQLYYKSKILIRQGFFFSMTLLQITVLTELIKRFRIDGYPEK